MGDRGYTSAFVGRAASGQARASGWRLPIGAKLTLRYTAAIAVTLTVVALFVYAEVTRRVNREAKLLLEVEMRELADELRSAQSPGSSEVERRQVIRERFERLVRTSDPSLQLGVAWLGADGTPLLSAGILTDTRAPVPSSVLRGEETSSLRAVNLGDSYAYLAMAMSVPDGAVQMVLSTERYAENIARIREVFLLAFPIVLLLTGGAGFLLADTTLKPIRSMTQTARRISATHLNERIALTGSGDELDHLAETLNDMLARVEDGLSRMRRFNANAAHELRTPLTALSSQLDVMLERERSAGEYRQVLEDAHGRVHALSEVLDAMLRLARTEAGIAPSDRVPVPIRPVLQNVFDFFGPVAEESDVELHQGPIPDVVVMGDASWLHQLFANLVANAVKFTPAGGAVAVLAELDRNQVSVRVRDTGPGLAPTEADSTFERFNRGKQSQTRPGFGLGLPIAREIARAHGGDIEIERAGPGATFRVTLPIRTGTST